MSPRDNMECKRDQSDVLASRDPPKKLATLAIRVANGALALLSSGATGTLVIGGLLAVPFVQLNLKGSYSLDQIKPSTQRTLVLYSEDGRPFAKRGGCVGEPVRLSELPQHLIDAVLAMEDRRFRYHLGIDPIGLTRALYRNWQAEEIVQGGSTITQQLAKNVFLSNDRTFERKRKEALLSLWLEWILSKEEILERYLSTTYFGEGCYGVRAAARHYFGKKIDQVNLAEAAYLVALLKSPSRLAENAERAWNRAKLVLQAMVEHGTLDATKLIGISSPARIQAPEEMGSYFADWVASTIRVSEAGNYSPLPVHTTFDPELQSLAETAVETVIGKRGEKRRASEAALVAMRADGRVVAMVGGRNYAESQFNRAVQAKRQPGSSFKLFVYLAALRAGLDANATINDDPVTIGDYTPKNFGSRFRGPVSVRQAFASSINTVAVRLSEALGRDPVIAAARDLGISSPLQSTPSLALGSYEVSLLELTAAYCAVAAGAYPVKPWTITGFGAEQGLASPPRGAGIWSLEARDDLRALLQGVVRAGSGRRANLRITAYGKTGTSQQHRDAWFIGFAGNLVAGVWVGNDNFSPMKGVTGGQLPTEIWHDFMSRALEEDHKFERELRQIAAFPADERSFDSPIQLTDELFAPKPQRSSRAAEFTSKAQKQAGRARVGDRWTERSNPPPDHVLPNAKGFLRHLFN